MCRFVQTFTWMRQAAAGMSALMVFAGVSVLAAPGASAGPPANLCIRNDTTQTLQVKWRVYNSKTGTGELAPRKQFCAQGQNDKPIDVSGSVQISGVPSSRTEWDVHVRSQIMNYDMIRSDELKTDWLFFGQNEHICRQHQESGLWYRVSREANKNRVLQYLVIVTTGC